MRKNYVQDFSRSRSVRLKRQPSNSRRLITLLVCFCIVLSMSVYFEFRHGFFSRLGAGSKHPVMGVNGKKTSAANVGANGQSGVQFDFYDTLSDTKPVNINPALPQPVKTSAVQKPTVPETGYVLTMGEFPNRADAARARLSLLLSGVDTTVKQFQMNGRPLWRIQKGPFSSQKAARAEMLHLKNKGIESQVLSVS